MLPIAEPFFLPIFSANLLCEDVFTSIISLIAFANFIYIHSFAVSDYSVSLIVDCVNTFLVIGGFFILGETEEGYKVPRQLRNRPPAPI
jgi:hypothetical protein